MTSKQEFSSCTKYVQADLRAQYDKEQELYQNKSLLSKESKERLEVNFMYEPPPGELRLEIYCCPKLAKCYGLVTIVSQV